jgi:8-oxo-dGTP pyrophosphatase MutT (NUDIX family)
VSGVQQCGSEINTEKIRQCLTEFADPIPELPSGRKLRAAAVLIPLVCCDNEWHLLYTRRTDTVQNHKGQVAFPGGAVESDDDCREDTALRETQEEIGVDRNLVDILGRLWEMPTITGFAITPVVGVMTWPTSLTLSHREVSRAFLVPLRWLADITHLEEVEITFPDGRQDKVIYYYPFDGEKIWGATARITLNFLKVIGWYPKL